MTPDKYTIVEKILDVGDGHKLYIQIWGNKNAKETIVFLHGGPGSGCKDKHKLVFDPKKQKVIFFDQRGAGQSIPNGSLKHNDTDHLIEDINKVTQYAKVDKFVLTGGSWGSCLALAYGIRYPKRVTRMVLRGIFTGRQNEIDFIEKGYLRSFFPEEWEEFVNSVPDKFKDDPILYHQPRILGKDKKSIKKSAFIYSKLESSIISLDDRHYDEDFEGFDSSGTIIECYFISNQCFLSNNYIVKNAKKLTMPIKLVQGRYDMVCPPFTAYELSQKLPNAQLYWTIAGHSGNDRETWNLVMSLLANP